MDEALQAGCQRLDLFFMTGLRQQTYDSVMGTVDYCGRLLKRYAAAGETRVIPFISPLAPFVDPGSRALKSRSAMAIGCSAARGRAPPGVTVAELEVFSELRDRMDEPG
jgi:hypothetical protein